MVTVKENQKITLPVVDIGSEGQGIGKYNGFTVFVDHALPGETVEVLLTRVTKNFGIGKLLQILIRSPERITPPCPVFARCGGCELLHLCYEAQLQWKQKRVRDCLTRIGGLYFEEYLPIIGMEEPYRYRNKMACVIGKDRNEIQVGMFAAKSHEVVDISAGCLLHDEESLQIMSIVKQWANRFNLSVYSESQPKGILRHIVTRHTYNGDLMAVLVTNGQDIPYKTELITELQKVPGLCSVMLNMNFRNDKVILSEKNKLLWGKDTVEEMINGLKFSVSVQSFFQVNRTQAERLYCCAIEMAQLTGEETVYDLYCGTGTITQLLAQKAGKAIGIEVVPAAVADAKKSALENHSNARFYAGKAEEVFPNLAKEEPADVVVLDPPRKGSELSLLQCINQVQPKRIVYISCNPATLARDAAILANEGSYCLDKVQAVDMFPHTTHVETVALMIRTEDKLP